MANQEQLRILKQGVDVWNRWREENPQINYPDLNRVDLSGTDLRKVNFSGAELFAANLNSTNLSEANLSYPKLQRPFIFGGSGPAANLQFASLRKANLNKANLSGANLKKVDLSEATLSEADLRYVILEGADLGQADLRHVDLRDSNLSNANFYAANLAETNLYDARLIGANLSEANLNGANLVKTDLRRATLSGADIDGAIISNSQIHGINVWDLTGEFKEQQNLVITNRSYPRITVDNVKIAQFIYLILNNEEIRHVIDTVTSKSVLILGRFQIPERKVILDGLSDKLREYDLLPIVFDFDRPTDKDFTETIKTLAGLSYFVIADVTHPKSSPLELQATVPDYQIPFVPIIQEGESPFAMMVDLQKKYNWVLPTVTYDSMETLIKILKPLIIDPAMKKRNELRIIKAQVREVISGKEFLEKGKE